MNDIIVTGDDAQGIANLKCYLQKHLHAKDLESLRYFLDIEVARSRKEITLSQRKYVLNMLSESDMLGCKLPITHESYTTGQKEILDDIEGYRQLVGKLNYLTITRLNIIFVVSVVSQFLLAPRIIY